VSCMMPRLKTMSRMVTRMLRHLSASAAFSRNVTTSTRHGETTRGLLEYIDELVADYSLNQYKMARAMTFNWNCHFGASTN